MLHLPRQILQVVVLCLALVALSVSAQNPGSEIVHASSLPEIAADAATDPEILVIGEYPIINWTVGGDMVYWEEREPDSDGVLGPQRALSTLKRMPISGGDTRTLATFTHPPTTCPAFAGLAADSSGVVYANDCQDRIEMIPVTAQTIRPWCWPLAWMALPRIWCC